MSLGVWCQRPPTPPPTGTPTPPHRDTGTTHQGRRHQPPGTPTPPPRDASTTPKEGVTTCPWDQSPGTRAKGQEPGTKDQGPRTRDQGPGPGTRDQGSGARTYVGSLIFVFLGSGNPLQIARGHWLYPILLQNSVRQLVIAFRNDHTAT